MAANSGDKVPRLTKISIPKQAPSTPDYDPELDLVDLFCKKDKNSIDVGASRGKYTKPMLGASAHVYAYEPLAEFAHNLRAEFQNENITVRACALSDSVGTAFLNIPLYRGPDMILGTAFSWSSIVKDFSDLQCNYPDCFPEVQTRVVPTSTLDQEKLSSIGFIKIDVEGAEMHVLRGAQNTIQKEHPILLIEIEERHRPNSIQEITDFLKTLDYEGFFVRDVEILPIAQFSVESMQSGKLFPGEATSPNTYYINNFIYIPLERSGLVADLRRRVQTTTQTSGYSAVSNIGDGRSTEE